MVEDTRPSDPSPAETLRRATALMRERARAARAGRWQTTDSALVPEARLVVANWASGPIRIATCSGSLPEGNEINAEHIASWQPSVALEVADLLDLIIIQGGSFWPTEVRDGAIAVARAYLGDGAA